MSQCLGIKLDGSFCSKRGKKTGYCADCDPNKARELEREMLQLQRERVAKENDRREKLDQKQEILSQELTDKILEIKDLEGLRRLELKVLQTLVSPECPIDARFGSPIVQLLKHQAELLVASKPNEGLKGAGQREIAIRIAIDMTPEQQIALLGDFEHGMKLIEKQVKHEVIETPYKVVENERA